MTLVRARGLTLIGTVLVGASAFSCAQGRDAQHAARAAAEQAVIDSIAAEAQALANATDGVIFDDPNATVVASSLAAPVVEDGLGPIDLLVANAAVTEFVPFQELDRLTVALWERLYRVNVIGSFLCVQAVVPAMIERGKGSIVLVSSNSTVTGGGSSIPYVASKGALNVMAQCLARALAPAVRVNAVAPGWMLTPWVDKYLPPEVTASLVASGRAVTPVDEVASTIAHVAANTAITGQIIVVDAGDDVTR